MEYARTQPTAYMPRRAYQKNRRTELSSKMDTATEGVGSGNIAAEPRSKKATVNNAVRCKIEFE